MRAHLRLGLALALLVAMCASAVSLPGQQVDVSVQGPDPAVVNVGAVTVAQIVVDGPIGLAGPPKPPPVDGLIVDVGSPSRRQFSTYVNGRTTVSITESWTVEIYPKRPGRFAIPAFDVMLTDGSTRRVESIRFEAVRDADSDLARLSVVGSASRVYVGEPWRVLVEVRLDDRIEPNIGQIRSGDRYHDLQVRADWFDGFDLAGTPERNEDGNVNVVCNQRLQPASGEYVEEDGRRWRRYRFELEFMPVSSGEVELDGPLLRYSVPQRGRFGEQRRREAFAYAEPMRLTVAPLPAEGRPASFSGAVGRFTMTATAEPTKLRVGESLKLRLRVAGTGNFGDFDAPRLPDLEGFHEFGRTETRDEDGLIVTYDLTPLATTATAIPSLPFSYFDTRPGIEGYRTVNTEPITLEVLPLENGGGLERLPGAAEGGDGEVVAGVDDIHDLLPAAAWDPRVAPAHVPRSAGAALRLAAVLAPWLVVLGALGLRAFRRASRSSDPRVRRARTARATFLRKLERNDVEVVDAFAGYLADRLGVEPPAVIRPDLADYLVAEGVADADLARQTQQAIDRGTAARYGGGETLDAETARALVERFEQRRASPAAAGRDGGGRGPTGAATLFAFAVLFAAGPSPRAQDVDETGLATASRLAAASGIVDHGAEGLATGPRAGLPQREMSRGIRRAVAPVPAQDPEEASDPAVAGRSAYRAGDYEAAAAAFASALDRPDADRRLQYALGNALYRQGRYAEALLAYERARLALPRDSELADNIRRTRTELDVSAPGGDTFGARLRSLRESVTETELLIACAVVQLLVAGLLVFGRGTLRALGGVLVPVAGLLALEVLWLGPARPPGAIVLERAAVRAEPRPELEPTLRLRRGVRVDLLDEGPAWSRIRVDGERTGWIENDAIGVVR
jgi:tetratricopeptide (TPR) repeat protein